MNLNSIKNLSVQRNDRSIQSVRVNPEHINYIGPDHTGKCTITMTAGLAGAATLAPTEELAAMAQMFRNLTSAQVYESSPDKHGSSILVNMARVALIEEKGICATLSFVDGASLEIVKTWS